MRCHTDHSLYITIYSSSAMTYMSLITISLSLQHLSSARHQEYANNEENFQSLDQLIAQGKPFSEFIHELRSAHSNR